LSSILGVNLGYSLGNIYSNFFTNSLTLLNCLKLYHMSWLGHIPHLTLLNGIITYVDFYVIEYWLYSVEHIKD